MNCDNCLFAFSNVYPSCQGYTIFDENYNFEIYRFCSLNCGLKFIVSKAQEPRSIDSQPDLVKKLKHFFDFYDTDSKTVKMALPRERLIIFDGDLTYSEYRKDFICPVIDTSYSYDDESITYILDENDFSYES
jgi:hypothetical protein